MHKRQRQAHNAQCANTNIMCVPVICTGEDKMQGQPDGEKVPCNLITQYVVANVNKTPDRLVICRKTPTFCVTSAEGFTR